MKFTQIVKLIYEKWTYSLFLIGTIVNSISIAILFFIKNKLWNEHFISELLGQRIITEATNSLKTVTIL